MNDKITKNSLIGVDVMQLTHTRILVENYKECFYFIAISLDSK